MLFHNLLNNLVRDEIGSVQGKVGVVQKGTEQPVGGPGIGIGQNDGELGKGRHIVLYLLQSQPLAGVEEHRNFLRLGHLQIVRQYTRLGQKAVGGGVYPDGRQPPLPHKGRQLLGGGELPGTGGEKGQGTEVALVTGGIGGKVLR